LEKKPLSTDEDTSVFFGMVKPVTRGHFYCGQTGDISNVV
jgi:hypothetical protein